MFLWNLNTINELEQIFKSRNKKFKERENIHKNTWDSKHLKIVGVSVITCTAFSISLLCQIYVYSE